MRQQKQILPEKESGTSRKIKYGNLELNLTARQVLRGGEPVTLAPKELELLAYLMERRGTAVSREELLAEVWQIQARLRTRTVDMHIRKLRKILPELKISTIFKFGYRLD